MKTITLDLNKLTTEQLQAYLMLQEEADRQFKEQNKAWMDKKEESEVPETNDGTRKKVIPTDFTG
jgi:hypothetical protein